MNPQQPDTEPTHEVSIGIDLGGTSLRIGAYDMAWTLLDSLSMPTRVTAGPDAVVQDIAEGVRQVKESLPSAPGGDARRVTGIGIGSPGPLNLRDGTLGHLPNFPGWDGFPLRRALEAALETTICLDGDANAAALAEWKAGSGAQSKINSMCMLTLGTGVGSGIILDGKIWHGMVGMGGEAGHIPLVPDGPVCGCGGRGCLEVFASATALCRMAREAVASGTHQAPTASGPAASSGSPGSADREEASPESLAALITRTPAFTARDIALLAAEGDEGALAVYNRLGFYLGYALSGLINTLDLPLYVIGGGLVSAWELFAPTMFRTVRDYSYVYRLSEPSQLDEIESDKTCIRPARLGASAGLLGAAMLPKAMLPATYPCP